MLGSNSTRLRTTSSRSSSRRGVDPWFKAAALLILGGGLLGVLVHRRLTRMEDSHEKVQLLATQTQKLLQESSRQLIAEMSSANEMLAEMVADDKKRMQEVEERKQIRQKMLREEAEEVENRRKGLEEERRHAMAERERLEKLKRDTGDLRQLREDAANQVALLREVAVAVRHLSIVSRSHTRGLSYEEDVR